TNLSLSNIGIPIVSSEWGYSSVWRRMNDEQQSEFLAREFLTNSANGIPVSIWYDWRDDGTDASEPEHHFGIVHNLYQAPQSVPSDTKTLTLIKHTGESAGEVMNSQNTVSIEISRAPIYLINR